MSDKPKDELAFGKENYRLFALAAIVVTIGYLLMVGGGSEDPNVFNYDELFSFRRITLAPIIVLLGFGIGFYGILKRPKNEQ
jgi:DMSO/TMAO reductase YedYZ molybdopterin-dependent catalytic subunit